MFRLGQSAVVSVLLLILAGPASPADAAGIPGDPQAGRILFERVWNTHVGGGGPLGPLYNERSCAACHAQGAIGGGGPNSHNVDLISVDVPESLRLMAKATARTETQTTQMEALKSRLQYIHTDLPGGSIVLHAYGTDPRYAAFRRQVLGLLPISSRIYADDSPPPSIARPQGDKPIKTIEHEGVRLLLIARNSTAMFGAGRINSIPVEAMNDVVLEQGRTHPEMKGRFLGRFGWRGQTSDLQTFVAGACGVELGLGVPSGTPPLSPVAATVYRRQRNGPVLLPKSAPSPVNPKTELDSQQFNDLVAFVGSLPAPGRRKPVDEAEAKLVRHGEAMFEAVECGVCHRRSLGSVDGLYSDLLLHDLGPGLYDPQPPPESAKGSLYYDTGTSNLGDFVGNRPYEWRTPPLWGLADSGPYLHDGRAANIERAIELHGGQSAASIEKYRLLPEVDRRALLAFLTTLIAPEDESLKRPLAQLENAPVQLETASVGAPDVESRELDERAAAGRLRLAVAARQRGETEMARRWLEAVVNGFPATQAAKEADTLLNPR